MLAGRLYSLALSNAESIRPSDVLSFEFFIIMLCLVVASVSYNASVFGYIKLYEEQRGVKPTITQVGIVFFRKLLWLLLYNFVVYFILVLVVIIPYLIVTFIPVIGFFGQLLIGVITSTIILHLNMIYIKEDLGLSAGISRFFTLFSGRWWPSIWFNTVMFLIYWAFSLVLLFIMAMISSIIYFTVLMPHKVSPGMGKLEISLLILVIGLYFLVQQVFYLILFCGVGVNYYTLSEEKDGSAIEEQIDNIGSGTDKYGGIEEQY